MQFVLFLIEMLTLEVETIEIIQWKQEEDILCDQWVSVNYNLFSCGSSQLESWRAELQSLNPVCTHIVYQSLLV